MAGLPKNRMPMRAERPRPELPETSAEGLLEAVRRLSVRVNITPAWPN